MPVGAAIGGAVSGIGGSLISSGASSSAAANATAAQTAANQAAIAEQQRQFNISQQNMAPWLQAGGSALQSQLGLLGLGGSAANPGTTDWGAYVNGNPDALANWNAIKNTSDGAQFGGDIAKFGQYHYGADGSTRDLSPYTTGVTPAISAADAQQSAINGLQSGPLYQSLYHNGEQTILNNAAATGGLRGGNTQRSLANFGADTLSQVIQNQLSNLGGISNTGNATAGSLANLGANTSGNVSNLLASNGSAQAGGILANAGIQNNAINGISGSLGSLFGNSSFQGLFGGSGSSPAFGISDANPAINLPYSSWGTPYTPNVSF